MAVDRVCRYENLNTELEEVRVRVGLPEPLALPHAKAGHRTGHYRDMINAHDAEIIARLFARDIELFGYRY